MDYSNSLGSAKLPLRAIAARLEFRSTTLQDAPTGPEHVATVVQAQTAREQRDVQRTMEHWRRNTWGPDCIPLLDTFDFSPMRGDWGYRFLICGDGTPENAVFVTYGPKLAQLLGLPERAVVARPFVEQIPESYRSTFVEGYRKAVMGNGTCHSQGYVQRKLNICTFQSGFSANHVAADLVKTASFRLVQLPCRCWQIRKTDPLLLFASATGRAVWPTTSEPVLLPLPE